jgi:hypothetical protein
MKILVVTGLPYIGLEQVDDLLHKAGLAKPSPGKMQSYDVNDWHVGLLNSADIKGGSLGLNAPLIIGKVWEELAVDVLLGNIGAKDWGFYDSIAVWTSDFWSDIDPQTRFICCFSKAEIALGQYRKKVPSGLRVEDKIFLNAWKIYNQELLSFCKKNPQRSVLLDIEEIARQPVEFIHTISCHFELDSLAYQDVNDAHFNLSAELLELPARQSKLLVDVSRKLSNQRTLLISPSKEISVSPYFPAKVRWIDIFTGFTKSKHYEKQLQDNMQSLRNEILASNNDLKKINFLYGQLLAERTNLDLEVNSLSTQLAEKNQQLESRNEELNALREELNLKQGDLSTQLAEKNQQLESRNEELNALRESFNLISNKKMLAEDNLGRQLEYVQDLKEKAESSNGLVMINQLQLVQNELEKFYIQNTKLTNEKDLYLTFLKRATAELPEWIDAQDLVSANLADTTDHKSLGIQATNVWLKSGIDIPQIEYIFGIKNNIPYMQIRSQELLYADFCNWSLGHDEGDVRVFTFAPEGFKNFDEFNEQIISNLSPAQLDNIANLLGLAGSNLSRLGLSKASQPFWGAIIGRLNKYIPLNRPASWERVEVLDLGASSGKKKGHCLRIFVRKFLGTQRSVNILAFDLEISFGIIKNLVNSDTLVWKFRKWKNSDNLFQNWVTSEKDTYGAFSRLEVDLKTKKIKSSFYEELASQDQEFIQEIVSLMPRIIENGWNENNQVPDKKNLIKSLNLAGKILLTPAK